jgi:serine phosphatase RsbU (regulator of sigma subunit)
MTEILSRDEIERRLTSYEDCPVRLDPAEQGEIRALLTARQKYRELDEARATNTRLNRRCTTAEAFLDKSLDELRDQGQFCFGRMLANYAANRSYQLLEEARGLLRDTLQIMEFYAPCDDNVARAQRDEVRAFLGPKAKEET